MEAQNNVNLHFQNLFYFPTIHDTKEELKLLLAPQETATIYSPMANSIITANPINNDLESRDNVYVILRDDNLRSFDNMDFEDDYSAMAARFNFVEDLINFISDFETPFIENSIPENPNVYSSIQGLDISLPIMDTHNLFSNPQAERLGKK